MTFTTTVDGFCPGGEHVHLTVHVGQNDYRIVVTRDELLLDRSNYDEVREAVVQRIKSYVLENHTGNWAETKAALEAAELKV